MHVYYKNKIKFAAMHKWLYMLDDKLLLQHHTLLIGSKNMVL
jgi:hypothetical protein